MARARRCPSCDSSLPREELTRCPFCKADLDIPEAHETAEEVRPKKRRRRRHFSPSGAELFDVVGLLRSAGAALLLLAVSAGLAAVIHAVVGEEVQVAATPPPAAMPGPGAPPTTQTPPDTAKKPKPPDKPVESETWQARPDPAAEAAPALDFPAGASLAMNGNPLFSSGDGRFVIDTPEQGFNVIKELQAKEAPRIPVYDLSLAKPIGSFPKAAPRSRQSLLSQDGRHLVTQAPLQGPGPILVAVWALDGDKPIAELPVQGAVNWMGFLSPDEFVIKCRDANGYRLQIWSIAKRQIVRQFAVAARVMPAPSTLHNTFSPDPLTAALSPGKKYLALGGDNGIALFALADGRHLGSLPLQAAKGRAGFRGLRFSDDGTELLAVVAVGRPEGGSSTRLLAWNMTDGSTSRDVPLANPNLHGPALPGPEPGTVFLNGSQFEGNNVIPYGQIVDAATGKTLLQTPYTAVRWLADQRLLAVGPLENAPATRGIVAVPAPKVKIDPQK
jgi:hypothetical protein